VSLSAAATAEARRAARRITPKALAAFRPGARVSVPLGDRAYFLTKTQGAPYQHQGAWFVRVVAPFVVRPIHPLHTLRLCA